MKTIYQIQEYGSFIMGKEYPGYQTLPEHTFLQLENFILANRSESADALQLMGLSAKKGIGKVITAKNYVGLITLKDGTGIEILPKIYAGPGHAADEAQTKHLLVSMIKTLRNAPFKSIQATHVRIENMNILEIFIHMFVEEVFLLTKRGLNCGYEAVQENAGFFKGKMLFSQQMQLNHTHKERCFVEYDAFTANRPENRLIKATLLYLFKQSSSQKNKNDIKILLDVFSTITASGDYHKDFSQYIPDRSNRDYRLPLLWCRVFLLGKSFTSFAGSEVALALLFPMENLFESYLAALLKKQLHGYDYSVSVQDTSYHLFDEPHKKFLLRPDIVVTRNDDGAVFVLDTKWKRLDASKANRGISQADMYQMFAYQKKYGARHVTLLYPQTETVPPGQYFEFKSCDGVTVRVHFIDVFHAKSSLAALLPQFERAGN